MTDERPIIDGDALLAPIRAAYVEDMRRARGEAEAFLILFRKQRQEAAAQEEINRRAAAAWREKQAEIAAEREAEQAVETERRREIARKAEEKRATEPVPCQLFTNSLMRMRWVAGRREDGVIFKAIAAQLGISNARAAQLGARVERLRKTHRISPRAHMAVPIDPGGPRDVWLEFYPPPDPRFDNMAPVTLDNSVNLAA